MDDIAKMKVLVCDDEALARMRLKRLVEMANMEVSAEAASGREAVESAGRLRPDVVLMDIQMPVMDGLTAVGKIREWEEREGVERPLRPPLKLRAVEPQIDPQRADHRLCHVTPKMRLRLGRFKSQ